MTAGRRTTLRALGGIAAGVSLALAPPALAQSNDKPVDDVVINSVTIED